MSWEVEFTDEFEAWWNALTEDEQQSIAASVGLLEAVGSTLTAVESTAQNTATCASCVLNMRDGRTERCMPSTHVARQFF